jgi:hypothetical protein
LPEVIREPSGLVCATPRTNWWKKRFVPVIIFVKYGRNHTIFYDVLHTIWIYPRFHCRENYSLQNMTCLYSKDVTSVLSQPCPVSYKTMIVEMYNNNFTDPLEDLNRYDNDCCDAGNCRWLRK